MRHFITAVAAVLALAAAALGSWGIYIATGAWWSIVINIVLSALFFPVASLLHELGHKLFGAFSGMKVRLGRFTIFAPSSCQIMPKSAKNVGRAFVVTACGGLAVNFILAAAGLVPLCFGFAYLSFLAPSSVYLFVINALPTRDTDMSFIVSAAKNTAEWQVLLCALTIQGTIASGTPIADIPEDMFFSVPQVAEDEPAFIMLVSLRADYFAARGDEANAKKWGERARLLQEEYM